MKGDFSKDSFHPEKHFHDVLMQQGRVLLDAEWNEQASINAYRTETGARDIIGKSGTPFDETNPDGGFQIIPSNGNADVSITKGHYYVDGILCENENEVLYVNQPDLNREKLPITNVNGDGDYLFYLDVWQRHITVLEDPAIREVALGGPDTTTRIKTIWQVKWKGPAAVNCANALDAQITASPTGKLTARSKVPENTSDPCGLAESGGYTRLENQLYRAEIHIGGANRASSTFKWSRDNGIVAAKWESQDSANKDKLVVSTIGRDEILSFKEGDWIELIDDRTDLLGKPGVLVELLSVEGKTLTIKPSSIKDPDNPAATSVSITGRINPRIRRWDSVADIKLNSSTWIPLEDGVEVKFDEGTFRTGDYWLIPARTALADVEWPFTQSQLPFGVKHHFALLGILKLTAGVWSVVSDCRSLFPPLTDLISLFYVSGDGQEAMPGDPLPKPLIVGVSNGQWPVKNARVQFSLVTAGVGSIITVPVGGIVFTNNEGQASCNWTLGGPGTASSQQVRAVLLDAAGNPMHLPVIFTANLSIASKILYDDNSCENWGSEPHKTVAEAITSLCKRKSGKRSCSVTVGTGGDFETLDEAFEKLADDKIRDVCICLLAPLKENQHSVTRFFLRNKASIKITGCGATIFVEVKESELIAEKITLHGINFQMHPGTQLLLNADQINVDHCRFLNEKNNDGEIRVLIKGLEQSKKNATLHWFHNYMDAGFILFLSNKVEGWIGDNEITGLLVLQFEKTFKQLSWNSSTKDKIRGAVHNNALQSDNGTLHIRGNILGAVMTNAAGIMAFKPQQVYKDLFVSENVFKSRENSFIAVNSSIINNHFPEFDNIVAFSLSICAGFTGNIGTKATGPIEAIFIEQIGVNPNLNLITVT